MSRLAPGAQAPELDLPTWKGERLSLSSLRGRPVWLGFYRYASCPLCNLRIHEICERYEELTAGGLAILGVFQSPPEQMARFVGRDDPPLPLLSDPEQSAYAAFGVDASAMGMFGLGVPGRALQATLRGLFTLPSIDGPMTRRPADFLIDEEGRIETAFYASDISQHIPFAEVEAFLARRSAGEATA